MSVADLQAALASPGANTALTRATVTTVPTGTGGMVKVALTPPAELAAKAGLTREEYALARCITSEGYGGPAIGKAAAAVAIGQAIRNGAALDGGKSIESKLTYSTFVNARGYFGEQSGRYAATTLDPTSWAGQVAQAVLADDDLPDLARGAHKFLDMKVFAGGEQAGKPLGQLEGVLRSWMLNDGLVWVGPIATVSTFHLVVLGHGTASQAQRQSQIDELLDIYEAGKAGDAEPEGGDPDDGDGIDLGTVAVLVAAFGLAWFIAHQGWV